MNEDIQINNHGLLYTFWKERDGSMPNVTFTITEVDVKANDTTIIYHAVGTAKSLYMSIGRFLLQYVQAGRDHVGGDDNVNEGESWLCLLNNQTTKIKSVVWRHVVYDMGITECRSPIDYFLKNFQKLDESDCQNNNLSEYNHIGTDMNRLNETNKDIFNKLERGSDYNYYYVTYDYQKTGRRGYGKGSIVLGFSKRDYFSIRQAEKIISNALKEFRIRNKGIVISNWIEISKEHFDSEYENSEKIFV